MFNLDGTFTLDTLKIILRCKETRLKLALKHYWMSVNFDLGVPSKDIAAFIYDI